MPYTSLTARIGVPERRRRCLLSIHSVWSLSSALMSSTIEATKLDGTTESTHRVGDLCESFGWPGAGETLYRR